MHFGEKTAKTAMNATEMLRNYRGRSNMEANRKGNGTQTGSARKRKGSHWLAALSIILAVAFMCGSYLSSKYFVLISVSSNEMENTLLAGDTVGCERNAAAQRGDIVAFGIENVMMLKRVIAVGGDVVDISDTGKVLVNGSEIAETYLSSTYTDGGNVTYPLTVPGGEVFVAGDNRVVSTDSRNEAVGTIPVGQIVAVARMRVWPFYRISSL
jgi:signal peptidase I